jgi:hypothetical protein
MSKRITWDVLGQALVDCHYDVDRYLDIMRKLLSERDPKPSKWHKVEDELPDSSRIVLALTALYVDPISAFYAGDKKWHCFPGQWELTITHWRELPKPPKKERTK